MTEINNNNNNTYFNAWYQKNKTKHLEYVNHLIKCPCGQYVQRCHIARHQKTKKHIKQLN